MQISTQPNPFTSNVPTSLGDSPNLDAFSRLRISQPATIFDGQMTYGIRTPDYSSQTVSGGAGTATVAHNANRRCATLTLAGAQNSGDYARLRAHYHSPYTAGRSQVCFITGCLQTSAEDSASVAARMGYYDETNGYYLQLVDGAASFVERTTVSGSTVSTATAQASWSHDPMDGTGPSGHDLDFTKSQILVIDIQALYAGRVRLYFDVGGCLCLAHEYNHANILATPYIQMAGLTPTWELVATAGVTVTSMTMEGYCSTVFNEGGDNLREMAGRSRGASNGVTSVPVTTRRPVFSIRPNTTFNSITNWSVTLPESFYVSASTNDSYIEIVQNGTLTAGGVAPTWNDVDATYSTMQKSVNADAISGGRVLCAIQVTAGSGASRSSFSKEFEKALLCVDSNGSTQDTLSIVATSFTGTSNVIGGFCWKEIR